MPEKGSGSANKPAGWHSRRHATSVEHEEARTRRDNHEKNKLDSAVKRQEIANLRTPEEQLKRIDAAGKTAVKERAKLAKRMIERKVVKEGN